VVTVPDGTSTGQAETNPGTPEQQINMTATTSSLFDSVAQAMSPVLGILGAKPPEPTTGGGGGGGAYMFASLEELDGVIKQWEDLADELKADNDRVKRAIDQTATPAGDDVSGNNYSSSNKVLAGMQKHNEELLKYTGHYIAKLKQCRTQMATTEQGNQAKMNQVH
jgi:hypothetical protein